MIYIYIMKIERETEKMGISFQIMNEQEVGVMYMRRDFVMFSFFFHDSSRVDTSRLACPSPPLSKR